MDTKQFVFMIFIRKTMKQCNECSIDSKTARTGSAKLHHACFAKSQIVSADEFLLCVLEAVGAYF